MKRERGSVAHPIPLQRYMPKLELPADARWSNVSGGGSSDELNSRVTLNTSRSREELLSSLGEQIRKQGWQSDSAWSGSVSSGTVWLLSSEENEQILGVLRVAEPAAGVYNVRFSISPVAIDKSAISAGSTLTTSP
jgi:hypothetical protein